ncbi:MAG: 2-oxoacid:acceptor oxidoreductase family protein [Deltaproteobacteria bacterium]|nr:2-oxoacid:acceptor oxidoreductase family protein [Deltaproteobacteria bacterium]
MHEVIWHGRGGQGVVIAAQILAESAYLQGFKGVTSAPTFGPERRGAPLTASTRISDAPIRTFSQIVQADIAVVLDPSLFGVVDILGSLKPEGLLLINTPQNADEVEIRGCLGIATLDAAAVAIRFNLLNEGAPMVNTLMLGVLSKASGLVSLDHLEKGLKWKLSGAVAAANIAALRAAYEETSIKRTE